MRTNERASEIGQLLKAQGSILGGLVLTFWIVEIIDRVFFQGALDGLGVRPRTLVGLRGILFGPFLHASFGHVFANTFPFLVLGWFVMVGRLRDFFTVSIITIFISGIGIWLIAPSQSVHIGASGLIFGYFGFLVLRGYFERSLRSILWSILVVFLYGGMVWGVLPQGVGISWQAHLFGFVGGGVSAYWLSQEQPVEISFLED